MAVLTFAQVRALWLQAGGAPDLADTMAAVAMAESRGDTRSLNPPACWTELTNCQPCNVSNTGDYSVGLWQINYYGGNWTGRKAAYGCPAVLLDGLANAKAAVDIVGGGAGVTNWSTYKSGAYKSWLPGGSAATATKPPQAPTTRPRTVIGPSDTTPPTERAMHLPEAFALLVHAVGVTVPTRLKWANSASRRFKKAIR